MAKPPPLTTPRRWHPAKQSGVEWIIVPPRKNRTVRGAFAGIVAMVAALGVLLSWLTPVPRLAPIVAQVDNVPKQSAPPEPALEEIKIVNPREAEPELKPSRDSLSGDHEWSQNSLEWNANQGEQIERAETAPPSLPSARPPHLLLAANPRTPELPLSEIRLRPEKLRQTVYLFANNPGETARTVAIESRTGQRNWEGGFTVLLAPHSTHRLNFGQRADAPATELQETNGPFECRLLDVQNNNEVLDELVVPVAIDPPRGAVQPDLRIQGQHFLRPNPQFSLPLEVNNAPDGATLEIAVGHMVEGEFKSDLPPKKYPSAKRQRIIVSPHHSDGGLVFEARLEDWVLPLDTCGLLGNHEVVARLIDAQGAVIAKAVHSLIVDDSPPANARILNAPSAVQRGSTVALRASATAAPSGIKEAQFFVGRPIDAKVPPNVAVVKATQPDPTKQVWEADVLLPQDKKGATEVTVVFTNQVGLSSFATAAIDMTDTEAVKTGTGRIKGTVLLGELRQPGLLVMLRDEGGNDKASTATGPDGSFTFNAVAPGQYTVYCRKPAAQRHGSATAVVVPNKDTIVTVALILRVAK
jgi:hypothetical protein